jgi:hypothetical protein
MAATVLPTAPTVPICTPSFRHHRTIRCREGENCIVSPGVVVRTKLQHELGPYRHDLPHAADLEMWMRFAVHASVGRLLGVEQAYVRVHGASMQHTQFQSQVVRLDQRWAAFEAIFREYDGALHDRRRLEHLESYALARDAIWSIGQSLVRRQFSIAGTEKLLDFACQTYLGETASLRSRTIRGRLIFVGQMFRLAGPAIAGLRVWPRSWFRARVRQLSERVGDTVQS